MNRTSARPDLPLRSAVVGSGGISKEHLSYLAGRTSSARTGIAPTAGRIRVVGVCDLSPVAARYGAAQFGADAAYTDVATLLEQAKPDVVHVLTPPQTHVAITTQCLEAGANVICEKPITTTAEELEQLLAVADRHDRILTESHNYRFNRGVVALREALDAGRLGHVREVEIRIALPVTDPGGRFGDPNLPSPIHDLPAGVIHDFTTHFTSVLLHLTGPVDFDRIAAAWSNHGRNPLFRYDNLDAVLIGSGQDGPVHGRLRFDADTGPDTFTVTVRGTNGWAETDLFQPYNRTVTPRPGGSQLSPIVNHVANGASLMNDGIRNVGRKILQQTPYEGLHRMLSLTYDALIAGGPMPVSPADMLDASRLVDRLLSEEARL
ncbi:MAG: Gfo/Idh/MocA family oxidoreductase [Actinomycetota bacterium]